MRNLKVNLTPLFCAIVYCLAATYALTAMLDTYHQVRKEALQFTLIRECPCLEADSIGSGR